MFGFFPLFQPDDSFCSILNVGKPCATELISVASNNREKDRGTQQEIIQKMPRM